MCKERTGSLVWYPNILTIFKLIWPNCMYENLLQVYVHDYGYDCNTLHCIMGSTAKVFGKHLDLCLKENKLILNIVW